MKTKRPRVYRLILVSRVCGGDSVARWPKQHEDKNDHACAASAYSPIRNMAFAVQAPAELRWRAACSRRASAWQTSSRPWPSGIGHQDSAIQGSTLACDTLKSKDSIPNSQSPCSMSATARHSGQSRYFPLVFTQLHNLIFFFLISDCSTLVVCTCW